MIVSLSPIIEQFTLRYCDGAHNTKKALMGMSWLTVLLSEFEIREPVLVIGSPIGLGLQRLLELFN